MIDNDNKIDEIARYFIINQLQAKIISDSEMKSHLINASIKNVIKDFYFKIIKNDDLTETEIESVDKYCSKLNNMKI